MIMTKKCSSKILYLREKRKESLPCNVQTISFLYLSMVRDGMKLKIDDIALFMSGFPNLNDLNSWSQLNN